MITQERLKELLHYNPDTGDFTWRSRSVDEGDATRWNGRYAEKKTGNLDKTGYQRITFKGNRYFSHRLAFLYMTGHFPPKQVDHTNHIRDDNRWANLTLATGTKNQRNRRINRNNKSGVCGVNWHKKTKKWHSHIGINGQNVSFGYYYDFFEAICARKSAEIKYGFHPNHGT